MRRHDLDVLSNANDVFAFVQTDDRIALGGSHGETQRSDALNAIIIRNERVVIRAAVLYGVIHKIVSNAGVVTKIVFESVDRCETHEPLDGINDVALVNWFLTGGVAIPIAKNLGILEMFVGRPVELVALEIVCARKEGLAREFVGPVIPKEVHLSIGGLGRQRGGEGRLGKPVVGLIDKFHHS